MCERARLLCVCVVGPHERVAGGDRSRGADLLQSARRAKRCREPITDGSKPGRDRCADIKRLRSARIITAGPALIQNLRRERYEIIAEQPPRDRVRTAFDQLALCI